MMASMMAGVGFPNSGLGAVHGLTLPLGGHFGIPHGTANAVMLPFVMRFNSRRALRSSQISPERSGETDRFDLPIRKVFALRQALGIPTLSSFKVPPDRLRTLARDALGRNSNCVTNPRQISEEEAVGVYAAALEE